MFLHHGIWFQNSLRSRTILKQERLFPNQNMLFFPLPMFAIIGAYCTCCAEEQDMMISSPVLFQPTSSVIDQVFPIHKISKLMRVLLPPPLSSDESLNATTLAVPSTTCCEVCASSVQYFTAVLMIHHCNTLPDRAILPAASLDIHFPPWPSNF